MSYLFSVGDVLTGVIVDVVELARPRADGGPDAEADPSSALKRRDGVGSFIVSVDPGRGLERSTCCRPRRQHTRAT